MTTSAGYQVKVPCGVILIMLSPQGKDGSATCWLIWNWTVQRPGEQTIGNIAAPVLGCGLDGTISSFQDLVSSFNTELNV